MTSDPDAMVLDEELRSNSPSDDHVDGLLDPSVVPDSQPTEADAMQDVEGGDDDPADDDPDALKEPPPICVHEGLAENRARLRTCRRAPQSHSGRI